MKLNQFESSISFIHSALPGYLRYLYEKFLVIENELYAQLERAYNSNPYSVNEYIKEIIESKCPQFIQIFKYIMSEENQINMHALMSNINDESLDRWNNSSEDTFETVVGADLVAPLSTIKIFISSFPYAYNTNMLNCNKNLPIMCIEPEVSLNNHIISLTENGYTPFIENENGNLSLFNNLTSVLKIDINHVFSFYFHGLFDVAINTGHIESIRENPFEFYRKFHNTLNDKNEETSKEIESHLMHYWHAVEGSAILCYMTYAGKLLGSKEDMVQWLYNTFVKGTVSDIETGDFFKNADITAFSGHQNDNIDNGYDNPVLNNFVNKSSIDKEKTLNKQFPDNKVMWNPNILYKHLRLNYSNWCTVINLISQINKSKDFSKLSEYDIRNKPNEFVFSKSTDIDNHVDVARKILSEYISHYFATYNVYVFPVEKEVTVASYFIKFVSNRIFNAEIKSVISFACLNTFDIRCKCIHSSCPHPRKLSDYFVNSEKAISILYAIKLVKNVLADLFMTYSYVIMLNGVYNTQDRIIDEKDALTGRSKKELFIEIYHSLIKKINYFLNNRQEWLYKDIIGFHPNADKIDNNSWNKGDFGTLDSYIKGIYTPLEEYIDDNNIPVIPSIINIRNILDKITSPLTFNKPNIDISYMNRPKIYTYFITNLYDIHPISVIAEISEYYLKRSMNFKSWYTDNVKSMISTGFTRSGNLFPRNRVTSEMLHKVRLYEPKLFTSSLESLDNILLETKEDAILGNNANYSFIGNIGGTVTNEEDNVEQFTSQSTPLPGDNSIKFNNGVEGLTSGLDSISIHKTKVNNLAKHWNELFTVVVLGGKELKIQ
jgi:hypothetical protein